MQKEIQQLQQAIQPYRLAIINHPLYAQLQSVKAIQTFTETHVFAVWDFMSLLKALQKNLTCVQLPWIPVGSANTRFLINEIVAGEESDIDANGNRCSHFELYLQAMQQCNADTGKIQQLIQHLHKSIPISDAMQKLNLTDAIQQFVNYTFYVATTQPVHIQAAVFTFGREDLIPDMFYAIVTDLNKTVEGKLNTFKYYLERHIEVDGEHHSKLAIAMVTELCGTDHNKWQEATQAAIKGLQYRNALWNSILKQLNHTNMV